MTHSDRRSARFQTAQALSACALLVAVFYLAPVEPDAAGARAAVRAVFALLGLLAILVLIASQVIRLARDESGSGVASLAVALFSGLMVFAFTDYLVAVNYPGQFSGITTKTDAFYFAMTTLATVGYGDIHATGQFGRLVVIGQQMFNLAVIATGATVLVNRVGARLASPREPGRPPPPG